MSEDDRVKNDDSLGKGLELDVVHCPILIVEALPDGRYRIRVNVSSLTDDPRLFGILMSDIVDHIASAYENLERDPRGVRASIYNAMKTEERLKQKDPTRGNMKSITAAVPKKSHH